MGAQLTPRPTHRALMFSAGPAPAAAPVPTGFSPSDTPSKNCLPVMTAVSTASLGFQKGEKKSVAMTQADRQAQRPQGSTAAPGSVPFGEQRAAFRSRAGHACFLTPAGERRGNERLLTLPEKPWQRAKSVTGQNHKENGRRPVAKPLFWLRGGALYKPKQEQGC